ncbi:MAG TPA: M50 family metallopeptidase [Candidatus Dojkabacteria bacterium]|nr:M50 family metallopeptidase [Candidatus Dojkabacteria bacterium]HQF36123.1 M50 family metallopeptidase [Candidatus Dojkabacteria bacterium]
MSLLIFIVIIGILVLVHELGHFVSALLLKIKVEEFAIGFGPSIVERVYKDIKFKLKLLPLGGYVKIYGQEGEEKGKDSYSQRPVWQRMLVITAGVFMNFVFASLLFFILLFSKGFVDNFDYSILDTKTQLPVFGKVEVKDADATMYGYPGSEEEVEYYPDLSWEEVQNFPSFKANIPTVGVVTKVNGEELEGQDQFSEKMKANKGETVVLTIIDEENKTNDYEVEVGDDGLVGIYWLAIESVEVSYPSLIGKATSGIAHSINYLQYQLRILSKVVGLAFSEKKFDVLQDVFSGPVAVYQTVEAVSKGPAWVYDTLLLSAFISLNLAFVNILPFPVLDGGYVVLLLVELVTRKKVSPKFEQIILTIGMIILLLLSVVIFVNDIVRYRERTEMFEISNEL